MCQRFRIDIYSPLENFAEAILPVLSDNRNVAVHPYQFLELALFLDLVTFVDFSSSKVVLEGKVSNFASRKLFRGLEHGQSSGSVIKARKHIKRTFTTCL